jgi:hypothetical protein
MPTLKRIKLGIGCGGTLGRLRQEIVSLRSAGLHSDTLFSKKEQNKKPQKSKRTGINISSTLNLYLKKLEKESTQAKN